MSPKGTKESRQGWSPWRRKHHNNQPRRGERKILIDKRLIFFISWVMIATFFHPFGVYMCSILFFVLLTGQTQLLYQN